MSESVDQVDSLAVARRTTDLSPWLSPVLVKELRQGMRTNLFSISFILLQVFMVLCVLLQMISKDSSEVSGFFWFFVVTVALVVQPLRGFSALSSEYQLNTMDLIQLTRLTAWRIIVGKWAALTAQTLLFMTGILPYLVMRYFAGNVDFVAEMVFVGFLCLGSAMVTAMTVGLSVFKSLVLRCLLLVLLAMPLTGGFAGLRYTMLHSSMDGEAWAGVGLIALCAVYTSFFFLAFSASRIAPSSENHATRKRLVALAFVLLIWLFGFIPLDKEALFVGTAYVLILATIDALTEPLPLYARVLLPFQKNFLTRVAGVFLTPGWISGLFFFALATLLWFLTFIGWDAPSSFRKVDAKMVAIALTSANMIAFPVLALHTFFARKASAQLVFGFYFFIQAGLAVITMVMSVAMKVVSHTLHWLYYLCPIPSILLVALESMDKYDAKGVLWLSVATTGLIFLLPMLVRRREFADFFTGLFRRREEEQEGEGVAVR